MTAKLTHKSYNENGLYNPKYFNKNQLSNCVLEVPQNINLVENNGTLTLKAGSVVTIPNGFEADGITQKFSYINIVQDVAANFSFTTKTLVYITYYDGVLYSTGIGDSRFEYASATNLITRIEQTGHSLPIAICTIGPNTTDFSIVQVFNGMGYIGEYTWFDRGIKVLFANGRNADGTLANKPFTTTRAVVQSEPHSNRYLLLSSINQMASVFSTSYLEGKDAEKPATLPNTTTHIYYATDTNRVYYTAGSTTANWQETYELILSSFNKATTDDTISLWAPVEPFKVANAQDLDGKWVTKNLTVAQNVTCAVGTNVLVYDLSDYLPKDNNLYEVSAYCSTITGATGKSRNIIALGGTTFQSVVAYAQSQVANTSIGDIARGIVVINPDRQLRVNTVIEGSAGTIQTIACAGYRKVR